MGGDEMGGDKKEFIYQKIYEQLKEQIQCGQMKPGEKLRTELELQQDYQVSRDTLRKALAKLEQDGLVDRKAALGTFVKKQKSDYQLGRMQSFTEQMHLRGVVPSSELEYIGLKSIERSDIRQKLNLGEHEKCYIVCRIRLGNGDPMAYETSYIPMRLCPDLQMHLNNESSLYKIYEEIYHHHMKVGEITLESMKSSADVQKKLMLAKDEPVLSMRCRMLLEDDTPLYYVECDYASSKYVFSLKIPR